MSIILNSLAEILHKQENHIVWLAIVALSDYLVNSKIDWDRYEDYILAPDGFRSTVRTLNYADEDILLGPKDIQERISYVETEYRFMLYRHWTLFDSMYHSPYVAYKLAVWKEQGLKNLQLFYAKMGIPLRETKKSFATMSTVLKAQLQKQLPKFAPMFGLHDICFRSFVKERQFQVPVSATDIAYTVTALLECASGLSEEENPSWEANFWTAYDVLAEDDPKVDELIARGMTLAKQLQEAVIRQAGSMLAKRAIVRLGAFRYALIKDSPDIHFFTQPIALSKLALFLLHTQTQSRNPRKEAKPLILCCLYTLNTSYLVVGIVPSAVQGHKELNFRKTFKRAAQKTGARIRRHSFDSSIIEVQQEDITKFMEYLHAGLL